MHKAEIITSLIRDFSPKSHDFFEETMFIHERNECFHYKAGIFVCEKEDMQQYSCLEEYWTRSFYAFIENIRIGSLFHKAMPLIHWKEITKESFSNKYIELLEKYTLEQLHPESPRFSRAYLHAKIQNLGTTINIMEKSIFSSVSKSRGGYVSYFILDDDIAQKNKWPKNKTS